MLSVGLVYVQYCPEAVQHPIATEVVVHGPPASGFDPALLA